MNDNGRTRRPGNGDWQRRRILAFVWDFLRREGYSPSYREIGEKLGLAVSTVSYHVALLRADGSLTQEARQPRTITGPGRSSPPAQRDGAEVPLIGQIAAGDPLHAEEAIEETFPLPRELVWLRAAVHAAGQGRLDDRGRDRRRRPDRDPEAGDS